VTELGKGGFRPQPPLNVDWDVVRKATAQAEDKPWSEKIATKRVPDPECSDPGCDGRCAAAIVGLWCTKCGKRAYG
jgi:hypothetical protein